MSTAMMESFQDIFIGSLNVLPIWFAGALKVPISVHLHSTSNNPPQFEIVTILEMV